MERKSKVEEGETRGSRNHYRKLYTSYQRNIIQKHIKPIDIEKPLVVLITVLLVALLTFTQPNINSITGAITEQISFEGNISTYTQAIDKTFDSSSTYNWIPEHNGKITSIKVSGTVIGEKAKIKLETQNQTYLILNSENLKKEKESMQITGYIVSDLGTASDIDKNESGGNDKEKKVKTKLEHQKGTAFDADDNGIESIYGAIDFVAENTFTWEVDTNNLCTRWEIESLDNLTIADICFGAKHCCNFLNLEPVSDGWKEAFYLTFGKYGATYRNLVSAQTIYADLVNAEVYYSDWSSLPAEFVEKELIIPVSFENMCSETCELPELEQAYYKFNIDLKDSVLIIKNITYTVIEENLTPIANITLPEITNQTTNQTNITKPLPELNQSEEVRLLAELNEKVIRGEELPAENETFFKDIEIVDNKYNLVADNINISGLDNISTIQDVFVGVTDTQALTAQVVAFNTLEIERADIVLEKYGNVSSVFKCDEFNFELLTCNSSWYPTSIIFDDNETHMWFSVDSFSGYSGGYVGEKEEPKAEISAITSRSFITQRTDFLEKVNMTYENNNFRISGLGQNIWLEPCANYQGQKYSLKNIPQISLKSSITTESDASRVNDSYKFSLNISTSAIIKTQINELCFNIVNGKDITYDNTSFYFGDEANSGAIRVGFEDLTALGFNIKINSTTIIISNLSGKELNLDPTVTFATNSITAVQLAPMSENTFVIAWCDETADDASFAIYNTDGTVIKSVTDVNTTLVVGGTSCGHKEVGVAAFNSTAFVYAWYDGEDEDVYFRVYDVSGTAITVPITVDADAGNGGDSVSVSTLNSTAFVVAWNDMTDFDASFRSYYASGAAISGEIDVDPGFGSASASVSVSAFNSTAVVYGWFDSGTGDRNDTTVAVYDILGNVLTAAWDVDTQTSADIGATNMFVVDVAALNSTAFAYTWFDNASQDINWSTYYASGTKIYGLLALDSSVDSSEMVSAAALNSTAWVVGYYDDASDDLTVATMYAIGGTISGQIDVSGTGLRSVDVASQDAATGIGLCDDNFVTAYVIDTSTADWTTYTASGASWDGTCPPPSWTSITNNASTVTLQGGNVSFGVNLADNYGLGYAYLSMNGSGTWKNYTLINLAGSTSTTLNITNITRNTPGQYVCARYWFNDSENHVNETSNTCFTINNQPPTWTSITNNASTTTLTGGNVSFGINLAGTYNLDFAYLEMNGSGTWKNYTLIDISGTSTTLNITNITGNTRGQNVCARYWFNDTGSHANESDNTCFTVGDITLPSVSVTHTPDPQGLGENVTISATITDNIQLSTVKFQITNPSNVAVNFTNNTGSGSTYTLKFLNYTNGTYSYTIFANDTSGNMNSSQTGSFELYINATIQVKTVKDYYDANEIVNLTDPPGDSDFTIKLEELNKNNENETNDKISTGTIDNKNTNKNNNQITAQTRTTKDTSNPINSFIKPQRTDFLEAVKMTYENNNFKISGLGQNIWLEPCANYQGTKFSLKDLSQISLKSSITTESDASRTNNSYKFSLNISTPTIIKTQINELCFNIVNGTDITYDNTSFYFGDEESSGAVQVSFQDLIDLGFSVSVNSSSIVLGNLSGKAFNLDPIVKFTSADVDAVTVTPITSNIFVVAYCDYTNGDTSFQVFNANGSVVTAEKDVDTSTANCGFKSVGVSALNSTAFVIGWYDEGDFDATFAVYTINGDVLTAATDADTDIDYSHAVSVSAFNSTAFVIGWFDNTDGDATFRTYYASGTAISAEIDADTDVSASYSVDVSAFNSTAFVIGWYDYTDDDATFAVYTINGDVLTAATDADTDVSASESVSVSAFNSTAFVIGWYDYTDDDATFRTYYASGTAISAEIDADTDAGTYSSVSVSALNSTAFVIGWFDEASADATFRTYRVNQTGVTSEISSETDAATTARRYEAVASEATATGIGLCDDNFVMAYVTSTSMANWTTYKPDGTIWDGSCPPPSWTSITNNASGEPKPRDNVSFGINLADNYNLDFAYLETNDTGTWTNQTLIDMSGNSATLNETHIINANEGKYVCARFWFNDSENSANESSNTCFRIGAAEANQSKIVNKGSTNISIYVLMKVQYYNTATGVWVDDDVVVNDTTPRRITAGTELKLDTLFNDKWNTTANASNGDGTYRVIAIVTDNNDATLSNYTGSILNATYNFTIDTTQPTWNNIYNNASTVTKINGVVNWTANISDNIRLSQARLETNNSGSWANETVITISGTSYNFSYSKTITRKRGNYTCGKIWFSDMTNHANETNQSCFTVANTPPPTPASITPASGNQTTNSISITCAAVTDTDSDTVYYEIYGDTSTTPTTLKQNTTTNTYAWTLTQSGVYYYRCRAHDAYDPSASYTSANYKYADFQAPQTNKSIYNNATSTTTVNSAINWTVNISDDMSLSYAWLEENATTTSNGLPKLNNQTIINLGNSKNKNVSQQITIAVKEGNYTCARFWFNDTSNNINVTSWSCFNIIDVKSPTYTGMSNTSTKGAIKGFNISWGGNLQEDVGLSYAYLETNDTGTWANKTRVALSGTSTTVNESYIITAEPKRYVCGKFWFNDTTNNQNETSLECFVTDYCMVTEQNVTTATEIARMSGLSNAHVELSNQSNRNYTYNLLCNGGSILNITRCYGIYTAILHASDTSNAHVELNNVSNYPYGICVGTNTTGYAVSCSYGTSCSNHDSCLASISFLEKANESNNHLADCVSDPYQMKVCCNMTHDSLEPTWTNIYNNASTVTKVNGIVNWTTNISDNVGLSYAWLEENATTTSSGLPVLKNQSIIAFGSSVKNYNVSKQITIAVTRGNYTCARFWFNDTSNNVNKTDWSCFTVANTPPTAPSLSYPEASDYTFTNRTPRFNWIASTDADHDLITYHLHVSLTENLTGTADQTINEYGLSNNYYDALNELEIATYWWRVSANDSLAGYSVNSSEWNFSVVKSVAISLPVNSIQFGSVSIGNTYATDDNDPAPILVQNDGTWWASLVNISANQSLWTQQALGTSYFQIKVDNSTENNSFNWNNSVTTWTNVPSTNLTSFIKDLNYTDNNDTAEIDVRITAPSSEPAGNKTSYLVLWWEESPA